MKGNLQWGADMQSDLTDAAEWAVKNRNVDPKRVAIAGGSYGGYGSYVSPSFLCETPARSFLACNMHVFSPTTQVFRVAPILHPQRPCVSSSLVSLSVAHVTLCATQVRHACRAGVHARGLRVRSRHCGAREPQDPPADYPALLGTGEEEADPSVCPCSTMLVWTIALGGTGAPNCQVSQLRCRASDCASTFQTLPCMYRRA